MARKRMIDPNIWQSEDFSKLSNLAKVVFIGLFSNADDYGYGRGNATYIKSTVFPYDDKLRTTDIEKTLQEIASNMSIVFYTSDGSEYYCLTNWDKWQKVDKPQPSRIPRLEDDSTIIRRTFDDCSTNVRRTFSPNRKEENRIEKEKKNDSSEQAPEPTAPPVITMPLNTGEDYAVSKDSVDEYVKLYPAVDVMQELNKMRGWLLANPRKRKTISGINAFINRWLAKEQDSGANKGSNKIAAKTNNIFTNYTQREYSDEQIDEILKRKAAKK